jgi:hypothetical protein
MIRWVLRERVGDVTPPSGVWERIDERLAQQAGMEEVTWWHGFRLAGEAVALWFLAISAVGARTELPHRTLGADEVWQGGAFCLADQYGILLRRLAVL